MAMTRSRVVGWALSGLFVAIMAGGAPGCAGSPEPEGGEGLVSLPAERAQEGALALDLDPDGDGILGNSDNCPNDPNPSQADSNGNGKGDACDPICLTLRRGLSGSVADTQIGSPAPNLNYGSATTIVAGGTGAEAKQLLLRFDLGAVPANARVTSAKVTLSDLKVLGSGTVRAHRATAPWSESSVTWNSFAGAFDPAVIASFPSTFGVHTFDISATAQAWVQHAPENFGLLLDESAGVSSFVKSSEYAVASGRPSLQLCYVLAECAPGTADCDENLANGCEASLSGLSNCGACGALCAVPNGTPVCEEGGACLFFPGSGIGSCNPGHGDCDGNPDNGCEDTLSALPNCGACGQGCDDGNACTNDLCGGPGGCVHLPVPDGLPCTDGNACTQSTVCQAGSCSGNPLSCPTSGQCPVSGCDASKAWIERFGDGSYQLGQGVAADGAGNVFLALSSTDYGSSLPPVTSAVSKLSPTGQLLWTVPVAQSYFYSGFEPDPSFNRPIAVVADSAGDVYAASGSGCGAGVVKLDPAGNVIWSSDALAFDDFHFQFGLIVSLLGCPTVVQVLSFAVDSAGDSALHLYIAQQDDTGLHYQYLLMARLDSNGHKLWLKEADPRFGGSPGHLAFDGAGQLVGLGAFSGSNVDLGDGVLQQSPGKTSSFLARGITGSSAGAIQVLGGTGNVSGALLAADAQGALIVQGSFDGTVSLGGPPLSSATGDLFVSKLGVWSTALVNPAGTLQPSGLAVDGAGNVVLGGGFSGNVVFGGSSLASAGSAGFVAKLDGAGGLPLWGKATGEPCFGTLGDTVAADGAGDVILLGGLLGVRDPGDGPLTNLGPADVLVAKFGATGSPCVCLSGPP